jgi:hypothetical protein
MNIFKRILGNSNEESVYIVSGLPRSGTSMMMSMLNSGGLEIVTDNLRIADNNNPKGYFEFERVKKLQDGDNSWVKDARGKVVKVISALIKYLPDNYQYKIIFMSRDINEILSSQRRMLERDGKDDDNISDEKMSKLFNNHILDVMKWMQNQKNIQYLVVSYNDILQDPENNVNKIDKFLGLDLDKRKMLEVIEPNLYRERK